MRKSLKLKEAFKKFCQWFFGNTIFALLPFAVIFYFNSLYITDKASDLTAKEVESLLKGGLIVFFFCSLMGSLAVDIWISKEYEDIGNRYPKKRKMIYFGLLQVPFWSIISLTTVYLLIVFGDIKEDYFKQLSWFPVLIIGISFVYCFTYKMYNFVKAEK
jgi:hypothetical protein